MGVAVLSAVTDVRRRSCCTSGRHS